MRTSHDPLEASPNASAPQSDPQIKALADARAAFSAYIEDAQQLEETAREFMLRGSRIAGHTATARERQEIYGRYFAEIERRARQTESGAPSREQSIDAVNGILEEMREARQTARRQKMEARELAEQATLRDLARETTDAPARSIARPGTVEHAAQALRTFLTDRGEVNEKAQSLINNGRVLARNLVADAARGDTGARARVFNEYFGASSYAFAAKESSTPVERRFTELLVRSVTHDLSTNRERSTEEKCERFDTLLEQLSEDVLISRSSPDARRAHLEAEAFRSSIDDARALYEPPEDRTRAEHADFLGSTNKFARDMYERGASVYGDVLIIPAEAHGRPAPKDDVRVGTIEHAILQFSHFVKDEKELIEKAQEFVSLGRQVAGRTSDGNARLAVFQSYYKEINHDVAEETFEQRDGSTATFQIDGKRRSPEEQRLQLDQTLGRMRETASAMKELEWKTEKGEFIEIGEWEQGLSDPAHAREDMGDDAPGGAHSDAEREEEEHGQGGKYAANAHEPVRLDGLPPRTPTDLSVETNAWLRYQMISQVDRQLESGAHPSEINRALNSSRRADERRARDELISEMLQKRTPEINHEHPVSRAEELRALYTLRLLAVDSGERAQAVASVDEQISRRQPSQEERTAAVTTVGARIGVSLERERERLNLYEQLEKTLAQLDERREQHRAEVRGTAAWRAAKHEADNVRREATLDAKIELIRGNTGASLKSAESRYLELTGEARAPSRSMIALETGEARVAESHHKLRGMLATPDIDREQRSVKARLAEMERHYRTATGSEINSSAQARRTLEPYLNGLERMAMRAAQEEAILRAAPLPARILPSERKDEPRAVASHPIYVALSGRNTTRLPLDNFNEYQVLVRTAAGKTGDQNFGSTGHVEIVTRAYKSLYGAEVSGQTPDRDAAYDYLKEYIAFRLQNEGTRMRNQSRLYRDFIERLDGARSPDELRREANSIRQENYDREKHPEKYLREREAARRNFEQTKQPLTRAQISKLFLAVAPVHYTDEMRRFRLDRAGTGRDREERIGDLTAGRAEASPSLTRLLTEFDRARSWNDVRYYTVQLLNAPEKLPANLPRFSRINLHAEHQHLAPAERDFLFNTIEARREELRRGTPARIQERTTRVIREQARSGHGRHKIEARAVASVSTPAREALVPRDSPSFQAYVAAATWREAELVTTSAARGFVQGGANNSGLSAPPDDNRSTIVAGISDRDLAIAATVLREFKPAHTNTTAAELGRSSEREKRQLGEILSAFQSLRHERLADGRVQYKITTPERSEIRREEWEQLLRYMQPRLGRESPGRGSPTLLAARENLRQQALKEAWVALAPRELRELETIVDAPPVVLSKALDAAQEIKGADALQSRAKLADTVLRETIAAVEGRAARRLKEQHIPLAGDHALVASLAASLLRGGKLVPHAPDAENATYDKKEVEHAMPLLTGVVTPLDVKRCGEISLYAARTKNEYLASFRRIDAVALDLNKAHDFSRIPSAEDREREMTESQEKQSPAHQRYHAAVREYEKGALATELRRALDEHEPSIRARLAEIERSGTGRVRDLVPGEWWGEIRRAAGEEAWWALMPPELMNTKEQMNRVLRPEIERAAVRVSETISSAQLIGRGLEAARDERSIEPDNAAGTLLRAFVEIDRAESVLNETRAQVAAAERQQLFSKIRAVMERDVGSYLKGVLHEQGETAFLPGKGQDGHAGVAANIMKEAFSKHGVRPEQLNLSDHRLDEIAASIVSGLPAELAANRERERRMLQQQRAEQERETMRVENVLNRQETGARGARSLSEMERAYGHGHGESETLNLDEQFVTEKVGNRIDRTQESLPATTTSYAPSRTSHTHKQHFDHATEVVMHKEHVHQHGR